MLDQLLGKRLSRPEKLRVIGTYAAVYGVPIGATAGMLSPWYSDIKETAERDYGIKTDEGAWQQFFQGALSWLTEGITGDEYNPGKRYGPGGLEMLKALFDADADQSALSTILGAAASILGDAVRWAQPAVTTMWSQVWDTDGEKRPFQTQEFIDAFRSISTVNNGVKAYMAYYYHSYFTRDNHKLADASETDALMTGLFGLTNSSIETMYQQIAALKDDKAVQDAFKTEYLKAQRNAWRAETEEERTAWARKARIYLKSARITPGQAKSWFSEAGRGNESLILEIDNKYRQRFIDQLGNK
jgi:hypothetical protein